MVGMDSVKLLMSWNIKDNLSQAYFEFVLREFVPQLTQLGIETTGAWYTTYRHDDNVPHMLVEGMMESAKAMHDVLKSDEWQSLHDKLLTYVDNYEQKVVPLSGGFQL